ncbi:MAG TPA: C4-type zinc ribbon domain-containing protein [Phycisphaerae bacterium]|nr:C4-type zinc ribbon domain-containing protein [Phycisphaerae bacterium]
MSATVTLPALLALYKIDRELQQYRVSLDNVQKDQKRQQLKIAGLVKELDTQDTAHKKLQADISTREMEIKTRQDHIEKARASLNSTKTNKEYSAILITISAEKAEVAKMETALLEIMQQAETLAKSVAGLREQIGHEQRELAKIESEHADKVSTLNGQISGLQAKRNDAAKSVPAEALRQYDRVSQKYPGDAMAPVEFDESDLDSVSCGSCFMGLNVEHLNALRGRDAVRRCDSCNRILYLPEMLDLKVPAALPPGH